MTESLSDHTSALLSFGAIRVDSIGCDNLSNLSLSLRIEAERFGASDATAACHVDSHGSTIDIAEGPGIQPLHHAYSGY
jgi:hypothetical protein